MALRFEPISGLWPGRALKVRGYKFGRVGDDLYRLTPPSLKRMNRRHPTHNIGADSRFVRRGSALVQFETGTTSAGPADVRESAFARGFRWKLKEATEVVEWLDGEVAVGKVVTEEEDSAIVHRILNHPDNAADRDLLEWATKKASRKRDVTGKQSAGKMGIPPGDDRKALFKQLNRLDRDGGLYLFWADNDESIKPIDDRV